jgi:hypothetical protein
VSVTGTGAKETEIFRNRTGPKQRQFELASQRMHELAT